MKTIVLSLLLIVFVRSLPAFSDNGVNSDHKNIIAGIPRSFPPQYITDEKGISTGLAIDLMDAIALKAGLHIQYKVMETWAEVYEALKQGDVHIVPNLGITREREGFVDFTVPLETFAVSTFIRKDSVNIQSFNDLSGLNVGAVESNVGARLLKDRRDINLTVYDGFPEALLELLSGHIEGIVYPEPVVWRLAQEANLDHKIQVLSPPLLEIKRAIGVIKDHPVLFQKIQNATIAFVKTNEFQEILSKWNGEPTPYWTIHRLFWIMILVMVIMSIVFFIWRYIEILSLNNKLLFETKQKRSAENALKKLNDELEGRIQHRTKELAEAMRVGQMGSWEIDLLDNKSKWSEQLFKLLEIDPLNVKASSKAFFNTVHPDDREKVHKAYINSIESVSPYVITHRLLMSDGRTKWVEERSESSFNKQGKAVISRGTVQDITLQKQAELKLEQQHSLLMSFIETIPDAVYIKDGRGAWQLVNQVGLSLFQMGEFPWQGKTELELSQQRPGFSEAHEACLISDENAWNSGEIVIDYEKLNDEDGNSRVLEVRKMPLFDKKGERQSLLIIGRDITEQKSSQKKLQLAASVVSCS
jgi:PAS domain S-box-containing protein